jgi:gliding motility-associated-like protein
LKFITELCDRFRDINYHPMLTFLQRSLTVWLFSLFALVTAFGQNPILIIDSVEPQNCADEPLILTVRIYEFQSLSELNYSMQWDPNVLYLDSVGPLPGILPFITDIAIDAVAGNMTFEMDAGIQGQTLPDLTVLYLMYFNVMGDGDDLVTVEFANAPVTIYSEMLVGVDYIPSANDLVGVTFDIFDPTVPAVQCPPSFTHYLNGSSCSASLTWDSPEVIDGCDPNPYQLAESHPNPSTFIPGTELVSYQYSDAAGNANDCNFLVTVLDTIRPTLNCIAGPIVHNLASNVCTKSFTIPTSSIVASDNCGYTLTSKINGAVSSMLPGENFIYNLGAHLIQFTAQDPSGNTKSCTFSVLVNDVSAPLLSNCPANQVLTSTPTGCSQTAVWSAPAALDCNMPVTWTNSHASGSVFPVGTTTVTLQAKDVGNNSSTCSFTITINDVTPPSWLNCPANTAVNASTATCGAVYNWVVPVATDNCTLSPTIAHPDSTGGFFPIGTHAVNFVATDQAGNSNPCTFVLTVMDDNTPSFVANTCPTAPITLYSGGSCDVFFSPQAPVPAPNCTHVLTNNLPLDNFFTVGPTTVTYTLTYPITNVTAVCNVNIMVLDTIKPTITCPASTVIQSGIDCQATAAWGSPLVNDNCPTGLLATPSIALGASLSPGVNTIVYTATDISGNTKTCSFNVTVVDQIVPTISNCPSTPIMYEADPVNCFVAAQYPVLSVTDNCTTAIDTAVPSVPAGTMLAVGTHIVNLTVTDNTGNSSTCNVTIQVNDNTPPVFASCPTNTTLFYVDQNCEAIVTWDAPLANDACTADPLITANHVSGGTTLTAGETLQVICTASDEAGNQGICAFNIEAVDTIAPTVQAIEPVTLGVNEVILTDNSNIINSVANVDCGEVLIDYTVTPVATDNCPTTFSTTLISGPVSGGSFPAGTTALVYTVQDGSGNTTLLNASIDVVGVPNQVPVLTPEVLCQGQTTQLNTGLNTNLLIFSWVGPDGFTSNEAQPTISASALTAGDYIVTVTDNFACTGTGLYSLQAVDVPDADYTTTIIPCLGGQLDVAGTSTAPVDSWQWTDNQGVVTTSQTISLSDADAPNVGQYQLVACNGGVCCDTTMADITQSPFLPPLNLVVSDPTPCLGQTISISTDPLTGAIITWVADAPEAGLPTPADGPQIAALPTALGSFTYTIVTTLEDCQSELIPVTIEVLEAAQTSITTTDLDPCELIGNSISLSEGNPDAVSYAWEGPNSFSQTGNNVNILITGPSQAGTYTVTITDNNGCGGTATYLVAYGITPPAPSIDPAGDYVLNPNAGQPGEPDILVCEGSDITLMSAANPGNTYLWTTPQGNDTAFDIDVNDFNAGNQGIYQLYETNNGCTSIPTNYSVGFIGTPDAIDDQFTIPAQNPTTVIYSGDNDVPNLGVVWTLIAGPDNGSIIGQDVPGAFILQNDTTYGGTINYVYSVCSEVCPQLCDEAIVTIRQVIPCLIPAVISPNGDGIADVLVIGCLQDNNDYPNNEIALYNEWGALVYEAAPYLNTWVGLSSNGAELPDGTYFYIFRTSPDAPWQEGFTTVLRGN